MFIDMRGTEFQCKASMQGFNAETLMLAHNQKPLLMTEVLNYLISGLCDPLDPNPVAY